MFNLIVGTLLLLFSFLFAEQVGSISEYSFLETWYAVMSSLSGGAGVIVIAKQLHD